MILKEGSYTKCETCGRRQNYVEPIIGCDCCGKELADDYLRITVFWKDSTRDTDETVCCSWNCALRLLDGMETNYFIDLPYLCKERIDEFWTAIKAYS